MCASSARDHSTCRFFELSCTALSSNACSCARAKPAHASVSLASHSSEPPLPKGPCATCGSRRASMISLDFSSGALSCAITAPPLLMAAGRVVPANDKGAPALKAVADPTSIAAKAIAFLVKTGWHHRRHLHRSKMRQANLLRQLSGTINAGRIIKKR